MCKFLVECGAVVNAANNDGFTPFYMACQNGHLDVVKYLHSAGANINCTSNAGFIPLHVSLNCYYIIFLGGSRIRQV